MEYGVVASPQRTFLANFPKMKNKLETIQSGA